MSTDNDSMKIAGYNALERQNQILWEQLNVATKLLDERNKTCQSWIEALLLIAKNRVLLHDTNLELHEGDDFEESEIRLAESGYILQQMREYLQLKASKGSTES